MAYSKTNQTLVLFQNSFTSLRPFSVQEESSSGVEMNGALPQVSGVRPDQITYLAVGKWGIDLKNLHNFSKKHLNDKLINNAETMDLSKLIMYCFV